MTRLTTTCHALVVTITGHARARRVLRRCLARTCVLTSVLWPGIAAHSLVTPTPVTPRRACSPTRPVASTISVGFYPRAIALDPRTQRAFVENTDGAVSVLDTRRDVAVRSVTVNVVRPDPYPDYWLASAVAVDEHTGRVFVTNYGDDRYDDSGSVSILDATSGVLLRTLRVGLHPVTVALAAHTGHVFVANAGDGTVSMLDATSGALLRTIQVSAFSGSAPGSLAVDEQTGRVFVADTASGDVYMLDARTGALLHTESVAANTVVVDTRGGQVFAAEVAPPVIGSEDPNAPGANGTVDTVRVLDARRGTLLRTLHFGGRYHIVTATALAVGARAGRLIVAWNGRDTTYHVSVLDAARGTVLAIHEVGAEPAAAIVDERSGHAFVAHWDAVSFRGAIEGNGSVSVLDVRSGRVLTTLPAGGGPIALAVEPTAEQLAVVNGVNAMPNSTGSVTVLNATTVQ